VRAVAAPRDDNDILNDDRARLSGWAPAHGWNYIAYRDAFDLLAQLAELHDEAAEDIHELEIVAHGNPAICDDVLLGNAAVVGESLRRVAGINQSTVVYLSGCNTGLELNGECIARTFAAAFRGPVLGARGYLTGTHAEQTEQCVASFLFDGILYHSYSGGSDATGDDVWVRFGSPAPVAGGGRVQVKIATSGFRAVSLTGKEEQELLSAVEQLVRTPPVSSARIRMAPDLTFAMRLEDGEHVFELLAGGTVLRDPVTRNVWQFERGRVLLQSLLPYRKLPAA
jgi:hypothetical protein